MSTKIFYAADSTVAQNTIVTYPQSGIGQALSLYLKKGIIVHNHAVNGRSTKSFIDEARLSAINDEIREGDFLFIQFGHNDEKIEDASRYTEAFGSYQLNLEKFINVARSHGAYPVLITSLYRRHFDENGTLIPGSHGDYPEAMKQIGERLQVPVIDLCTKSMHLLQKTGEEGSRKWFMYFPAGQYPNFPDGKQDNTHLRYEGALVFAGMIAEELKKLGGIYEELIVEDFPGRAYLPDYIL
ncbi:MAG: rhamnogalacturonan acetylesterase [Lachnospiraceae bacterium]